MTGISRARWRQPVHFAKAGTIGRTKVSPDDLALMRGAFDAVCWELGIAPSDNPRREDVARRIVASYETGRKAPLYLVHAGLSEHP